MWHALGLSCGVCAKLTCDGSLGSSKIGEKRSCLLKRARGHETEMLRLTESGYGTMKSRPTRAHFRNVKCYANSASTELSHHLHAVNVSRRSEAVRLENFE